MPPEPLPWDRKELFRDRERDNRDRDRDRDRDNRDRDRDRKGYDHHHHHHPFGGGPGGPIARWRDSSSSPRWGFPSSDFRRNPPPGHGKQGGWHMYPEDSPHGYPNGRSGDRFMDDDGFRPSLPRGDGRFGRFYRDNRFSFGQKDWRGGHSWDNNHHYSGPPSAPSRPHSMNNDQRSFGDSPMRASHPHSDPSDQFHSREQADKPSDANGSGAGQRIEKENSLGSLDWKPLKWSRSGSLTSRGSGLSHSSSSKSNGGESNDLKGDLPPKNVSPIQSPSGDAVACAPSQVPSEETTSRKKPRLGWGEGLAKYEKKKVEGPEENPSKVGNVASLGNAEATHSLTANLVDKSPRVTGFSDCSSPATPSSFACSSSPGLDDKVDGKATDADGDANNFSVSSMPVSENQLERLHFSLEKFEMTSISYLSSLLNELLQVDDQCSDGFVKSSALNKLLLWKSDISKELESTETEIDSLENELKSLKSDLGSSSHCAASLNSLSADCKEEPCEDPNVIRRPPPLEVVSSRDVNVETLSCDDDRGAHTQIKDVDVDSPGTATSKLVEPLSALKPVSANGWNNCCSEDTDLADLTKSTAHDSSMHIDAEKAVGASCQGVDRQVMQDVSVAASPEHLSVSDMKEDNICDAIFTSNKESAARASEVLVKSLPSVGTADTDKAPCLPADLTLKERFLRRKRFLRFKEKVVALKYRALQHLWKEDLRSLSLRSQRTKPQKKNDLTSRTMLSVNLKHRSSIRSRVASPARILSLVPTAGAVNSTGKLLSDSQVKIYRSTLKMPAMILDEKEKMLSRFVSSNGLVEDPCAMEKERTLINPWTIEEKEIFMDKLATHGKDFNKIASFLDHKSTADCVEFYYKNHKSECFDKTRKKLDVKKLGKPLLANTYLLTSGKKCREANAASLDILGAASVIAAQADEALEPSKLLSGRSSNRKSRGSDSIFETPSSYYVAEDERETAAADVLAGICGSISSEAMSSCITSSIEPGEGNQEWKHQKVGSLSRRPLTPDVTQNVDDDTYSDESCGEMDPVDWTDDEKSLFVQAFSSYGKDFLMIARSVRTKSRDQCKVFFSKARKCLGLDSIHPGNGTGDLNATNDGNGSGSDTEDPCIVETGSIVCSDKSGSRMDEDLLHLNQDVSKPEAVVVTKLNTLEDTSDPGQLDHKDADTMQEELLPGDQADVSGSPLDSGVVDVQDSKSAAADDIPRSDDQLTTENGTSKMEVSMSGVGAETGSVVSSVALDPAVVVGSTNENLVAKLENGLNGVSVTDLGSIYPVAVGFANEKLTAKIENGSTGVSSTDPGSPRDGWFQRSETEDNLHCPESAGFMMNHGESSQDLKGFPLNLSIKTEMNDVTPCKLGLESKGQYYMRKCSHVSSQNAVAELPLLVKSEGQTNDCAGSSSSKTDKPCGNGDVKLFGKILSKPASADRTTPRAQDSDDKLKHRTITAGKFDMKSVASQDMDVNSTAGKLDNNSFLGLENVPIRSYGFWDGTKIQTGFPSLPDSALLLAKYPAAFANYSIASSKTEQQPLQGAVSTNECNVNGACVFSPREFSNSNGSVADYPVYRNQEGVQPFGLEMKQRQDTFPEVQRNGFEAISSIQQQGKGLVKLNVVQAGDIVVGGSCTGISDPVAALKLHYARTQQYGGGHAGNGIVREGSWRGQGDVGR